MPPRVDGSLSAASFLRSACDVNYIAVLYGQVTDSNDPEHVFSVFGVEWWNVEGHYVRNWAQVDRLPEPAGSVPGDGLSGSLAAHSFPLEVSTVAGRRFRQTLEVKHARTALVVPSHHLHLTKRLGVAQTKEMDSVPPQTSSRLRNECNTEISLDQCEQRRELSRLLHNSA